MSLPGFSVSRRPTFPGCCVWSSRLEAPAARARTPALYQWPRCRLASTACAAGAGAAGWFMVGIGRDQFSLRSGPLAAPPQPIDLSFPVDVRAIVVRGDEQARRSIRALTIEPVSIRPAAERLSDDYARHAVRYGMTTVFFLDERSFPEPEAFWIGGARGASAIVAQPDAPQSTVTLLLRNAPVDNRIVIQSGRWREDMSVGPGEERRVQVPIDVQARRIALHDLEQRGSVRPPSIRTAGRPVPGGWIKGPSIRFPTRR